MWFSRLSLKLFFAYAVLNLSLAIVFVTLVASWQRRQAMARVAAQLEDAAILARFHLLPLRDESPRGSLQARVQAVGNETGIRFELLDAQGVTWADSIPAAEAAGDPLEVPELVAATAGGQGVAPRNGRLFLAQRIDDSGGAEGFLRVSLPLDAIEADIDRLHDYLWISALLVGLIALGLTLLVANRIMGPLADLTEAAEAVAAGDYDQRIATSGNDELGLLGRAVNRMRRELTRQVDQTRSGSQLLETLLSSMREGVLAVNAERRVLFANDASKTLLGIDTREVIGRRLLEVSRNRMVRHAVEEAFRQDRPLEIELETTHPPRRNLALRVTRLPGQPPSGVVVVLYDITELRRLENVRREFVTNVSHELKTPLSSIKAYAETLRLGALHDAEHNVLFVERIEEQAERLHQLILDLLHLARVESGKEAFDIRDVSVTEVVQQRVQDYQERAAAKGLSFQVELPGVPAIARADRTGLATILDNLVSNAIQYTPEGGSVRVRVREDDRWIELAVEDTGLGIAARDQQRIFERFYRVDKARSRELGGTGLGLAIVKHLAQAFSGQVGLVSELGAGSTFWVRLPRPR